MRWGIYTRISLDRQGNRAGVERQRADCNELIRREDPSPVIEYYEDNDKSAWSGSSRPAYDRLSADVAAGRLDKVAIYHHDRAWRSVYEREALMILARHGGLKEIVTPTQRFDPADADDEFASTILVAVAQKASADTSRRMKRRQQEKAQRGEFHGGPRAFGHTASRDALVNQEAELIRDAARRVLRGESMRSIVIEWNTRETKSTRGVPWRVDSLRDLLQQPRLAGLREHLGQLHEAQWPAIIEVETWQRLRALFDARRRGPNGSTRSARKNLLSGMLRCHKCGQSMVGTGIVYRCQAPGSGGCAGATVRIIHANAAARDKVLDLLDSPAFAVALHRARLAADSSDSSTEEALTQIAQDRRQLEELGDAYADGALERSEYRRLVQRLEGRIAQNEAVVIRFTADVPSAIPLSGMAPRLRDAWDALGLHERRDVLRAVVDHFVVEAATPPMNRFKPDRVRLVPKYE